jgi:hypothetical protein
VYPLSGTPACYIDFSVAMWRFVPLPQPTRVRLFYPRPKAYERIYTRPTSTRHMTSYHEESDK